MLWSNLTTFLNSSYFFNNFKDFLIVTIACLAPREKLKLEDNFFKQKANMTEASEDILPVIFIMIIVLGILYPCIKFCENCKKNSNEEIALRIQKAEDDHNKI